MRLTLPKVVKVIAKLTTLNKIDAAMHTVEGETQVRIAFAANGLVSSWLGRKGNIVDAFCLVSEEVVERGIRYHLDVMMLPSRDARAREIVVFFYHRYKISMREPKKPFLRLSEIYEKRFMDFLGT